MSNISLRFAGGDYWDRTRPLIDGTIRPAGIDLTYDVIPPGDLFRRMCQTAEFEASEMSTSSFMAMITRGDDRLVGIPIFPSRVFRHRMIFVNRNAHIERPQDLAGKRVGVPEYQMSAAVWQRAFLRHDYDVHPSQIEWYQGGLDHHGYRERMAIDLPPEIRIQIIPDDKTLYGMLAAGELDALIGSSQPKQFRPDHLTICRLFPNYREVEKDYFRRTGLLPMMHMVAIRRDVYEKHRWVVKSLMDAFEAAKAVGWERLVALAKRPATFPWLFDDLEEVYEVFGGHPYHYGFEENFQTLQTYTEYSFEQGLSKRKLDPKELFAPESIAWTAPRR